MLGENIRHSAPSAEDRAAKNMPQVPLRVKAVARVGGLLGEDSHERQDAHVTQNLPGEQGICWARKAKSDNTLTLRGLA